jgi:VWFA-related protein
MIERLVPAFSLVIAVLSALSISAQPNERNKQKVRTVTIPIAIYTKQEMREGQTEEYVQADRLSVKEDQEEQTILSIRSVTNSPLSLEVLVQDDLTSEFNLQLKDLQRFIRGLPRGSRVMVAYIRAGTLQVRQRFTEDLDKAASSLRILAGTSAASGNGPYGAVRDAIKYFEALPAGRRAILLLSDGLDASQGVSILSGMPSIELDRAINESQRKSVAVYSIFSNGALTARPDSPLITLAQGGLLRLSDETGGRAFVFGSSPPVSIAPFIKDLGLLLSRQFALTYLSTHMKKGYHKVDVTSTNPEVKIEHPKGYYYR